MTFVWISSKNLASVPLEKGVINAWTFPAYGCCSLSFRKQLSFTGNFATNNSVSAYTPYFRSFQLVLYIYFYKSSCKCHQLAAEQLFPDSMVQH